MSLIRRLFGADASTPPEAMKLDGTTEATLARSLSTLPLDERGWITFAEARILFSTEGAQYAFGETDRDGRRKIESFAARHRSRHQLHAGRGTGLFRTPLIDFSLSMDVLFASSWQKRREAVFLFEQIPLLALSGHSLMSHMMSLSGVKQT